jgi:predicted RNase H-like HicB family nuclease
MLNMYKYGHDEMPKMIRVRAEWDGEAKVWVAESEDLPGLITEAKTAEGLMEKLSIMIPDLLEARGELMEKEIPFEIVSHAVAIAHAQGIA